MNPLDALIPTPPPPAPSPVDRGVVRSLSPLLIQCTGDPEEGAPCQSVAALTVGMQVAVLILGGTRLCLGQFWSA